MKIKRLEVVGFKSFCDRAVVHFNEPITAVVGPNGCGKSNIVDAIRWCMGEQSAKHLRGKSMDDVIFAGSDSRGPLGVCEVTLVFENDGNVPIEYLAYSEIAVTRKLYRDGTSEYYLNKTPCRLRDVVDFFLGTGIGAKAYSIIEQGRVGMIVSSRPEDRRQLIEEAAGITKFKVKKKAAEKKMEGTRQNLLRVSDVVAEIEKQLGSLRRQAQKAERYRQYKAELREIDLWGASQRWLGLVAEERVSTASLDAVVEERQDGQANLVVREAELEGARLEAAEEERVLTDRQERLYELDNRIKLAEHEAEHEERQARDLHARSLNERAEAASLAERLAVAEVEETQARAELAELLSTGEGRGDELRIREEELRLRKEALAALQREVDTTRSDVGVKKADIARGEAAERAAARRRDDLQIRLGRLAEEESRLGSHVDELGLSKDELEVEVERLTVERERLVVDQRRAESRRDELRPLTLQAQSELSVVDKELQQRRARLHSLEEIHTRYEGFDQGTRAILQERQNRWGILGPLGDLIEAPAEYEAAVEAVLAHRLGAVVVETQEVGVDAVELLKEKRGGRASFIPRNRFAAVVAPAVQSANDAEVPEGVLGKLIDHLKWPEEHDGLVRHLFADVVIAADLLVALDLWRAGHGSIVVTCNGELVERDGTVTGGSREAAAAGLLQQKREMRELEEKITALAARHLEAETAHRGFAVEQSELQTRLEELGREAHQHEMALVMKQKDLARLTDELKRTSERKEVIGDEGGDLQAQTTEAAREAEEGQLEIRQLRDQLVTLEDRLSELGRTQVALIDVVERAAEAVTTLKVEVAAWREKRVRLEGVVERLRQTQIDFNFRRERLSGSAGEAEARASELAGVSTARRAELVELADEHVQMAEAMSVLRGRYEERRGVLSGYEVELKIVRHRVDALGGEQGRLELLRHDQSSRRTHIEETIAERYRLDLRTQLYDFHLRPLHGAIEEARAETLRDLIERMGEINLHAIEEYNALETRFNFLAGQKGDLEQALAQLEEAIDRINKTSKKRFREVFDLVNERFQQIFPRCFAGGHGRLVLTDEENLLDSGIEIIAQPPGKKNATVEMLSGGEKAMTAVALIFAIFLIKPSPFCLLDEVDAPLDEANVGRFNDLIRDLTDRTQFIVITHNKRTMQIADTLYGVTMEEPGISKLVSVNLSGIGKDGTTERRSSSAAA